MKTGDPGAASDAPPPQKEDEEKNLARVDTMGNSTDSLTARTDSGYAKARQEVGGLRPRQSRSIEQCRAVLSMLCHYIWHKHLREGEHLWSIPADNERDFDCVLSDAIDELAASRVLLAQQQDEIAELKQCVEFETGENLKYEEALTKAEADNEALARQLAQVQQELGACELRLRQEWWSGHGCPFAALYGDDGEMQCNASTCRMDFKREPFEQLQQFVERRRLEIAGAALAQGRGVPPPQEIDLKAALRAIFMLTDAASIEVHSGDREPGRYITREQILGPGVGGIAPQETKKE